MNEHQFKDPRMLIYHDF